MLSKVNYVLVHVSGQVSASYGIAGSTPTHIASGRSNVVFEDISVSCVCRPTYHDSSLYLFVMVVTHDCVVLPLSPSIRRIQHVSAHRSR